MKAKIILVSAFVLLISACAAPSTPAPSETTVPAGGIQSTLEPSPPSNGNLPAMTTYTDDLAGFSLDHPAGWSIESSVLVHAEEVSNYSISLSSWDINNPPPMGANGLPGNGAKFDVTVIKGATTLEAAVEEVRRTGTPILAQEDVTLANGVPGVILDIEGFAGRARMLISILNGNVLYVTGYGDLDFFEPVALSLRGR